MRYQLETLQYPSESNPKDFTLSRLVCLDLLRI